MKKISLGSLFSSTEYHAPLLSSVVKKRILSRTIGKQGLFVRMSKYVGVGFLSILVVISMVYYGAPGKLHDRLGADEGASVEEVQDYRVDKMANHEESMKIVHVKSLEKPMGVDNEDKTLKSL